MKPILLLLAFANLLCAEAPTLPPATVEKFTKAWPHNKTINLVFHGHSVPSGYHKTPEVKPFESYPQLLFQRLKEDYPLAVINIILTSIGGEDSIQGAARFERDVLPHRPDVIFIDYGLNDRRRKPDEVEAAWRFMTRSAKQNNIPVILITPTGDSSANPNNPADPLCIVAEIIRKVAHEESCPLADVFVDWRAELAKGTPQTELLSQVNHPNLRGHTLAAETLHRHFIVPNSAR